MKNITYIAPMTCRIKPGYRDLVYFGVCCWWVFCEI